MSQFTKTPGFKYGAVGLFVIAICSLGYVLVSQGSDSGNPEVVVNANATQDYKMECNDCHASFEMKPADFAAAAAKRDKGQRITCPKCGAKAAWRAGAGAGMGAVAIPREPSPDQAAKANEVQAEKATGFGTGSTVIKKPKKR